MTTDLTLSLPAEVLLRIFDELGDRPLPLLQGPGHVCARWRTLARAHPVFTREVSIGAGFSAPLDLFLDQLAAGEAANTGLHLFIVRERAILRHHFSRVARHFPRCITLSITYDTDAAGFQLILDNLAQHPAPKLQRLQLFIHRPTVGTNPFHLSDINLPPELLLGEAPALDTVALSGEVYGLLPPGPPIAIFTAINSLAIFYSDVGGYGASYPMLSIPPTVQHLEFASLGATPPSGVDGALLATLQLQSLVLDGLTPEWDELLSALDVTRVPELSVYNKRDEGAVSDRYARCLRGPLELSVEGGFYCTCALVIRAPHKNRMLRVPDFAPESSAQLARIQRLGTDTRIVLLESQTRLWSTVPRLAPSFPDVKKLVLYVDRGGLSSVNLLSFGSALAPLPCPALREVELKLCAQNPTLSHAVAVQSVTDFMRSKLSVEVLPSLTIYRPLFLEGDRSMLLSLVDRIVVA
ncbi:hypothetical protein AURDEDRAFT_185934 [Auricularia subglabra TFB-10046 SS5]|nr:hypothetical protein AURDEDRAFT_185934 [Auricularia subglabra TFB-10046 SS5]